MTGRTGYGGHSGDRAGLDVEVTQVTGRTGYGGHLGDREGWATVEVEGKT